MHGYELIRSIKRQTRGAYGPSPGMVYPALAALDEMGLVIASSELEGRKAFAVTPAGEAEVSARAADIDQINQRLTALAAVDPEQHAPIRRAMDNLKMVLTNAQAGSKPVSTHDIAAVIDEAAQKIERLG